MGRREDKANLEREAYLERQGKIEATLRRYKKTLRHNNVLLGLEQPTCGRRESLRPLS